MSVQIHPTAIVDTSAVIGDNVTIGAYSVIDGGVVLGDNCHVASHVVLTGDTTIGHDCRIFPFASIGHISQDLKYSGEPVRVEIGHSNIIRENVTINAGTKGGGSLTRIGNHCLLMTGVHIGHDCLLGDNIIIANTVNLGGHVVIDDYAIIGGSSAVHQFTRIGAHAMIGGMSAIENDIIPFATAVGNRAFLQGLNLIGLKRRHFSREDITVLKKIYAELFSKKQPVAEAVVELSGHYHDNAQAMILLNFLQEKSSRGICLPEEE